VSELYVYKIGNLFLRFLSFQ